MWYCLIIPYSQDAMVTIFVVFGMRCCSNVVLIGGTLNISVFLREDEFPLGSLEEVIGAFVDRAQLVLAYAIVHCLGNQVRVGQFGITDTLCPVQPDFL